jgi:hypothetical protein
MLHTVVFVKCRTKDNTAFLNNRFRQKCENTPGGTARSDCPIQVLNGVGKGIACWMRTVKLRTSLTAQSAIDAYGPVNFGI